MLPRESYHYSSSYSPQQVDPSQQSLENFGFQLNNNNTTYQRRTRVNRRGKEVQMEPPSIQ